MLETICQTQTDLSPADIQSLKSIAAQLPLMAELDGGDVFIDCMTRDGRVVVAAHGRPVTARSAYESAVVGAYALPEREPAVFHALELRAPVRDIKAITQENRTVRQNVVPLFGEKNRCIALLIREQDISGEVLREKKYQRLASSYEAADRSFRAQSAPAGDTVALREMHHRIKNNLQLVASILNLQARRCGDDFTRKILRENVGRVLSIAAIHDILTKNQENFHSAESLVLLEQLRRHWQALVPEEKELSLTVTGTSVPLPADTASAMALVVNELVTNALEHAFPERNTGKITVSFCAGRLFHTVTVTDDGVGFDPSAPRTGRLGLNIADATVRDRLHGHLAIHSDRTGTCVSFDLKTEQG